MIYIDKASISVHDLVENDILKKINSCCREPRELELEYFSNDDNYDKPIGKMILDICNDKDTKCDREHCKKNKSSHIYYMIKKKLTKWL